MVPTIEFRLGTNRKGLAYYSWPIGIVIFFVVLALFNIYLVKLAVSNHPDLISASPYESGLKYQEVVGQLQRAKDFKLTSSLEFGVLGPDAKRPVTLFLHAQDDSSLKGVETVHLKAIRPSASAFDAQVDLSRVSGAELAYSAEIALARPGFYLFELSFETQSGLVLIKDSFSIDP